MDDCYKEIELMEENIIITHNILDEFEEVEDEYINYQEYKNYIIRSYNLAVKLGYCEIIEIDFDRIKIIMPKYNILIDDIQMYRGKKPNKPFVGKLCKLIDEMYENKIIHWDFAPRNIGVDKNGDFKLIYLNDLSEFNEDKKFIQWFDLAECEFKHVGLGRKFLQVRKYLIEKINYI